MPSSVYRSQHPHSTPPTASTFGASVATAVPVTNVGGDYASPAKVHAYIKPFAEFGPRDSAKPSPTEFISAHAMEKAKMAGVYADKKDGRIKERRKPDVDCKLGSPLSSAQSQRNFIAENTSKVVKSKPPTKSNGGVDYMGKSDYGKVPEYLHEVKEQVTSERRAIAEALSASQNTGTASFAVLKESDREELLVKLKQRWEETMKNYQLLTHMNANTLTIGNLKRKEQFEQQLQEIEQAIAKIDHSVVLVRQ